MQPKLQNEIHKVISCGFRIFFTLLLMPGPYCLIAAENASVPQPGTACLTVLSFNIHGERRNVEGWRWDQRQPLVEKVIRDSDPDIFLVQEAVDWNRKPLMQDFPQYVWLEEPEFPPGDVFKRWGRLGSGDIAFKKDRFESTKDGALIFPPYDKSPAGDPGFSDIPRGGRWAILKDKLSSNTVAVLSLHLTPYVYKVEGQPKDLFLQLSVDAIAKWASTLPQNVPLIIGGDFNRSISGELHQRLIQGIPTLCDAAKAGDLPREGAIDWLLGTSPLVSRSCRYISLKDNNIPASDHPAVVAVYDRVE